MILVIDDDVDMLAAIRRMIKPLELDVRYFDDPREALAALGRSDGVRVILTDLDMPHLSGCDLLERCRRLRPDAVRLVMTGRGSYESAIRVINSAEVHRFLRKPFDADELRAAIASALARHHEGQRNHVVEAAETRRSAAIEQLERRHRGLTRFARDATGAYAIDGVRYRLGERLLASLAIIRDRH